MVPVVLPVLHGKTMPGRRAPDSQMEGDEEAHCSNTAELQERGSGLQAEAAPGSVELGLRQPPNLAKYSPEGYAILHQSLPKLRNRRDGTGCCTRGEAVPPFQGSFPSAGGSPGFRFASPWALLLRAFGAGNFASACRVCHSMLSGGGNGSGVFGTQKFRESHQEVIHPPYYRTLTYDGLLAASNIKIGVSIRLKTTGQCRTFFGTKIRHVLVIVCVSPPI